MNDTNIEKNVDKMEKGSTFARFIEQLKSPNSSTRSFFLATIFGLPVIILFMAPAFSGSDSRYFTDTFAFVFLYAAMALSLNLEVGYLGLPNFGKVAFIAVGAYTYAMVENYNVHWFGSTIVTGLILAMIVTGLFGIILTLPTLRLREDYLAIVTIVAGEILRNVFNNEPFFGGFSGFPVTNIFFVQFNPDKTMGGLFLTPIPFLLVALIIAGSYFGYIVDYRQKMSIFADKLKVRKYAYDRATTIATLFGVIVVSFNFLGVWGDPNIGLDIFALLIPAALITAKALVKYINISNLTLIMGVFAVLSLILGFTPINSMSNIYAVNWYFMLFTFAIMMIIYVIMQEIYNSPFGRALRAIREDDNSAVGVGKSIFGFRLRALFMANALAGLAGAAFALLLSSVTPQTFQPLLTFLLYIMVIVGGSGNNKGVIYGVIVMQLLIQGTRRLSNVKIYYPFFTKTDYLHTNRLVNPFNLALITVGITLIVFLIYAPQGIFPERSRNNEKYTDLLYLNEETDEERAGDKLLHALRQIPSYVEDAEITYTTEDATK